MDCGFAVGIVVLKIMISVGWLSMRLRFTATEKAGERVLRYWNL